MDVALSYLIIIELPGCLVILLGSLLSISHCSIPHFPTDSLPCCQKYPLYHRVIVFLSHRLTLVSLFYGLATFLTNWAATSLSCSPPPHGLTAPLPKSLIALMLTPPHPAAHYPTASPSHYLAVPLLHSSIVLLPYGLS
jgi:hypothetical protein